MSALRVIDSHFYFQIYKTVVFSVAPHSGLQSEIQTRLTIGILVRA